MWGNVGFFNCIDTMQHKEKDETEMKNKYRSVCFFMNYGSYTWFLTFSTVPRVYQNLLSDLHQCKSSLTPPRLL